MSSQSGSGHRSERQHAVGRKHTNVIPAIATIDVTVIDCRSGLPVQHAIIEYLKFGKVTTIDRRSMPLPRKGGHALLPQTNADGVVSIPLDLVTLRDGGKLELGFRGFAIVAEATRAETEDSAAGKVFRPLSTDASVSGSARAATGFVVAWPDDATQSGRAWGWRIMRADSTQMLDDPATWPEFQTVLEWELPPSSEPGNWHAAQTAGAKFSGYYPDFERSPIVVFALQYAAPAWFVPSTSPLALVGGDHRRSRYVSAFDFADAPEYGYRIAGLFMISRYKGPEGGGGGQDFGTQMFTNDVEHATRIELKAGVRQGHQHAGVDIAGAEGKTPVFAFTAGTAIRNESHPHFTVSTDKKGHRAVHAKGGGYGLNVTIDLLHNGLRLFYAHLSSSTATGYVRAGQLIGTVGRVWNCAHKKTVLTAGKAQEVDAPTSNYIDAPTHMHFEVRSPKGDKLPTDELSSLLGDHYSANMSVVPHNQMRRLLPCDCEGGTDRADLCAARPEQESSRHGRGVEATCWARKRGCCPYRSAE